MSTTTLITQRSAGHLSARALEVVATSPATSVHTATTFTNAPYTITTHMAWLGDVEENGCFSGNNDAKRITPGRLERYLT